jgi:hypothetical protein
MNLDTMKLDTKAFFLVLIALAGCGGRSPSGTDGLPVTASITALTSGDSDRPQGPPPEAYDACSGKVAGAACSVTLHDRTIAGTCAAPPQGAPDTRLACRPEPPPVVFEACHGKTEGAACTVTFGDHTVAGTCETPPGESRLGCRPSHPPDR